MIVRADNGEFGVTMQHADGEVTLIHRHLKSYEDAVLALVHYQDNGICQ